MTDNTEKTRKPKTTTPWTLMCAPTEQEVDQTAPLAGFVATGYPQPSLEDAKEAARAFLEGRPDWQVTLVKMVGPFRVTRVERTKIVGL